MNRISISENFGDDHTGYRTCPERPSLPLFQANVLDRIAATLHDLGSGLEDVVRVTVWVSDLALFASFNAVYQRYFKAPHLPARSTVQAKLAFDVNVETEVTAYGT